MFHFHKTYLYLLAFPLSLASCTGGSGNTSFGASPTLPLRKAPPAVFQRYRSNEFATMSKGWTQTMDMSGVSWNDVRTATLITPRHVVMAKHFSRSPLDLVVFHDRYGKNITRKLISIRPANGDVNVGLLDEPVPSNFTPYPLPSSSTNTQKLAGRHVIVSGQGKNLFVHLIKSISSGTITFEQDEEDLYGWGKNLIAGDSGNPSFLIVGKELVLIETHTTGGAGAGPYYGDPALQASIRKAVSELDSSYKIRTIAIP